MIARDSLQLLKTTQDKPSLYRAFSEKYNYHDAETVFSWAAKDVQFDKPQKGKAMAKRSYWIKGILNYVHMILPLSIFLSYTDTREFSVFHQSGGH